MHLLTYYFNCLANDVVNFVAACTAVKVLFFHFVPSSMSNWLWCQNIHCFAWQQHYL